MILRILSAALLSVLLPVSASAFGLVLSGVGAVNRSMGGAAVAAPTGASGAIHWNPASITGLAGSSMDLGMELLSLPTTLSSSVAANSLGPGVPPMDLRGSTDGDPGIFPLPTMAMVVHPEDSRWSYGLGVFTIGGFGVNYAADPYNPVLSPPPPRGVGVGPVYSRLQVFQIAPTAAYQVSRTFSVGLAPTVTLAELQVDPATFSAPDDVDGDGFPGYPSGRQTRLHWGGGVQAGAYLALEDWSAGLSVKSKQYFEQFRYDATDEAGLPRVLLVDFEYPMIVSVGAAFTGVDGLLLAADGRWIDYEGAAGFQEAGYGQAGDVTGLGWNSVFSFSVGGQYAWDSGASVRVGYSHGGNPIPDENAFFNLASPSITEHVLYAGGGLRFPDSWGLSVMALYSPEASVAGPWVLPPGVSLGGTLVQSDVSVLGFGFELTSFF